jgi:mannose-6-phosphate isomerase
MMSLDQPTQLGRAPIQLRQNSNPTFYTGAGRIAAFRGAEEGTLPEDWVGACTTRFGSPEMGLTVLDDGRFLRDAVAADPELWLGPEHVARYGANPALLVKLLDAGQRLPLHLHPDDAFATQHLGSDFGKTEAWVVLEAKEGAGIHVGFTRTVSAAELERWVQEQDVAAMLAATHFVPVVAGDAVLCPAGLPHAIGEGIFMVELQQPTDFSLMLEQTDVPVQDAYCGLDEATALSATSLEGLEARAVQHVDDGEVIGADSFFRCERLGGGAVLDAGWAILVVIDGAGALSYRGVPTPIRAGETYLIPYGAGETSLDGNVTVLRCRPPAI